MRKLDPIRAWKDPVYRASLSPEERAQLPGHPSGAIEIADEHLQVTFGGATTAPRCTNYTYANYRYCCPSTA
jgi:mersacidin/lichenicidin family type 2 lantibiotic